MPLLLAVLPFILKIAFWVLEEFFFKNAQDEESRRIFLELAQVMRQAGIKGVRSRFESEAQIDAGNDEWDRREKEGKKK